MHIVDTLKRQNILVIWYFGLKFKFDIYFYYKDKLLSNNIDLHKKFLLIINIILVIIFSNNL